MRRHSPHEPFTDTKLPFTWNVSLRQRANRHGTEPNQKHTLLMSQEEGENHRFWIALLAIALNIYVRVTLPDQTLRGRHFSIAYGSPHVKNRIIYEAWTSMQEKQKPPTLSYCFDNRSDTMWLYVAQLVSASGESTKWERERERELYIIPVLL